MIRSVQTRHDLKQFIEYPYQKYQDHPYWVPPLRLSEWEKFDQHKHPFFEHARMKLFLAEQDGRVRGRVAGIDNDNHNRTHHDNLAFFGFFEAEDETTAKQLLAAVEAWALELGRKRVRGPANPTMDDGSGFQINAFDDSPFVMMPYNPPEYPAFAEAAGYEKVKDLYAWMFEYDDDNLTRLRRLADRVRKRYQPVIRSYNPKRFEEELAVVKQLYHQAWEKNWGFVKYTDAEFDHLARELKLIIEPHIAIFLELHGQIAGLALALPDINQVFKRIGGRLFPFGIINLLMRKRIINRARLPILGVMNEHRYKGLELILIHEIAERSREIGYQRGECSWVLEDNESMNRGIAITGAKQYKTYRLYQKEL